MGIEGDSAFSEASDKLRAAGELYEKYVVTTPDALGAILSEAIPEIRGRSLCFDERGTDETISITWGMEIGEGFADVVVRTGEIHHVVEIKLAREPGTESAVQAEEYCRGLEAMGKKVSERIHIIHTHPNYPFRLNMARRAKLDAVAESLCLTIPREIIPEIRTKLETRVHSDKPSFSQACGECPHRRECYQNIERGKTPLILARVRDSDIEELARQGVTSCEEALENFDSLTGLHGGNPTRMPVWEEKVTSAATLGFWTRGEMPDGLKRARLFARKGKDTSPINHHGQGDPWLCLTEDDRICLKTMLRKTTETGHQGEIHTVEELLAKQGLILAANKTFTARIRAFRETRRRTWWGYKEQLLEECRKVEKDPVEIPDQMVLLQTAKEAFSR